MLIWFDFLYLLIDDDNHDQNKLIQLIDKWPYFILVLFLDIKYYFWINKTRKKKKFKLNSIFILIFIINLENKKNFNNKILNLVIFQTLKKTFSSRNIWRK